MAECSAQTSNQKLTVSIIVPAHREGEAFRQCLDSLARAFPQPDEVILISDGDGRGISCLAKEYGYDCYQSLSGRGPAKARNIGARNAKGDLLFFVDSDVAIPQNAVGLVQMAFLRNPGISAVIGSYDDAPASVSFVSQYKNLFHHYVHQNSNEEASTFWCGCGAVRREVFLNLGGFDEKYLRPCIEDIEFGYRLKKAGHRIRLVKALQCKHLKQWTIPSLLKTDFFDRALPWTELILRDRMLINDLNLQLSNRISVALAFISLVLMTIGLLHPIFTGIALISFCAILLVNFPLYRFFYAKRKLWFTIRSIPWHFIYLISCGMGFVVGSVRAFLESTQKTCDK